MDTLDILAYGHQVSHSAIMRETLLEIAPLLEIHSAPSRAPTQSQIIAKVLKALPTRTITHLNTGPAHISCAWKAIL
jgi:hypothetical protein